MVHLKPYNFFSIFCCQTDRQNPALIKNVCRLKIKLYKTPSKKARIVMSMQPCLDSYDQIYHVRNYWYVLKPEQWNCFHHYLLLFLFQHCFRIFTRSIWKVYSFGNQNQSAVVFNNWNLKLHSKLVNVPWDIGNKPSKHSITYWYCCSYKSGIFQFKWMRLEQFIAQFQLVDNVEVTNKIILQVRYNKGQESI